MRGGSVPCPVWSGCADVLRSPLAAALPVRLSWLGAVFFLVWIGAGWAFDFRLTWVRRGWMVGLGAALTFSLGLTAYSLLSLHTACVWCLAVLGSVVGAFGLAAIRPASLVAPLPRLGWMLPAGCLAAGVAVGLASGSDSLVKVDAAEFRSLSRFPKIGRGDPLFALVVDFGCPSCRHKLRTLAAAETAFWLMPGVGESPQSKPLLELFASAYRQDLGTRYCTRIPVEPPSADWIGTIGKELGVTGPDRSQTDAWARDTGRWIARHRVRGVPAEVRAKVL